MVRLDVSDVHELTARARREFRKMSRQMFAIVDRQAAIERRQHIWTNITGLLEENTRAHLVVDDSGQTVVRLAQMRDYATHVQDRGRNEIAVRRDRAALELDYYFDSAAMLIANGR